LIIIVELVQYLINCFLKVPWTQLMYLLRINQLYMKFLNKINSNIKNLINIIIKIIINYLDLFVWVDYPVIPNMLAKLFHSLSEQCRMNILCHHSELCLGLKELSNTNWKLYIFILLSYFIKLFDKTLFMQIYK